MQLQSSKYLLISIIFFLITNGTSCKKDPPKAPVYLNAEFKKYFDYQPGTYWIFYDSLKNQTDSLIVYRNDYFKPYWDGTSPDEKYTITMSLYNVSTDSTIYGISFFLGTLNSSELIIQDGYNNNINYPVDFTTRFPFDTGKVLIDQGTFNGYYQNILIGNLFTNGVNYNNTYKIEYFNSINSYSDVFYINADNGFLRIFLNNQYYHQNMYLIRNNIIK